jgi:hypothetical protein
MKRWPTRFDIFSAECQLAQTKLVSRASFAQVRSTIRTRLAQPSSIFVVTSLGALLGIWFARRNKPRVRQEAVSVRVPIVDLLSTLFIRFGLQRLADTWAHFRDSNSATR